jgi:regulator of replication initiation timing
MTPTKIIVTKDLANNNPKSIYIYAEEMHVCPELTNSKAFWFSKDNSDECQFCNKKVFGGKP